MEKRYSPDRCRKTPKGKVMVSSEFMNQMVLFFANHNEMPILEISQETGIKPSRLNFFLNRQEENIAVFPKEIDALQKLERRIVGGLYCPVGDRRKKKSLDIIQLDKGALSQLMEYYEQEYGLRESHVAELAGIEKKRLNHLLNNDNLRAIRQDEIDDLFTVPGEAEEIMKDPNNIDRKKDYVVFVETSTFRNLIDFWMREYGLGLSQIASAVPIKLIRLEKMMKEKEETLEMKFWECVGFSILDAKLRSNELVSDKRKNIIDLRVEYDDFMILISFYRVVHKLNTNQIGEASGIGVMRLRALLWDRRPKLISREEMDKLIFLKSKIERGEYVPVLRPGKKTGKKISTPQIESGDFSQIIELFREKYEFTFDLP